VQCQIRIAQDGTQDVVEIVGDTTCQDTDGFHLLGLPTLRVLLGLP
jgi:hypothetical protein